MGAFLVGSTILCSSSLNGQLLKPRNTNHSLLTSLDESTASLAETALLSAAETLRSCADTILDIAPDAPPPRSEGVYIPADGTEACSDTTVLAEDRTDWEEDLLADERAVVASDSTTDGV